MSCCVAFGYFDNQSIQSSPFNRFNFSTSIHWTVQPIAFNFLVMAMAYFKPASSASGQRLILLLARVEKSTPSTVVHEPVVVAVKPNFSIASTQFSPSLNHTTSWAFSNSLG